MPRFAGDVDTTIAAVTIIVGIGIVSAVVVEVGTAVKGFEDVRPKPVDAMVR